MRRKRRRRLKFDEPLSPFHVSQREVQNSEN